MKLSDESIHIVIVSGETSGDILGASLIKSINSIIHQQQVKFSGIGGPEMISCGFISIIPMHELSVMGFVEVLPNIKSLLSNLSKIENYIIKTKPDIVITIDSPGFNFRLAKRLKNKSIHLVHYVAPQVWAWRAGRAKQIASLFDHLLTLLPFEPELFEKEGLRSTFVGHPAVESGVLNGDEERFRSKHNINRYSPLLVVLPGSRNSEIDRLIKPFGDAVRDLKAKIPDLKVVLPVVSHLENKITKLAESWGDIIISSDSQEKYDAFAASNFALAASGTVSLELSLAETPMITAYKLHPITWQIIHRIVKSKYINLVNIIAGFKVVPEFIQDQSRSENLVNGLLNILENQIDRDKQISAFRIVNSKIQGLGSPSKLAAEVIVKELEKNRKI